MPFRKVNVGEEILKRSKYDPEFKRLYEEAEKELRLKMDLSKGEKSTSACPKNV